MNLSESSLVRRIEDLAMEVQRLSGEVASLRGYEIPAITMEMPNNGQQTEANTDEHVCIDGADKTPGFLYNSGSGKIRAGSRITITEGGTDDKYITIEADEQEPDDSDEKVKVDATDTTAGHLYDSAETGKLKAGSNITLTPVGEVNARRLEIAATSEYKVKADSDDSDPGFLSDKVQRSIEVDGTANKIQLVGDSDSAPISNQCYGTDENAVRGWRSFPAVSFSVAVTWDGGECRPKLQKGNFWYVDDVTFSGGTLTVKMVQMCLPMYDVPGYCPASGVVQMEDIMNGGPSVTFAGGKVVDPVEGTPLFGTNPATGETILMTVNADGTIAGHTGPITVLDPGGDSRLYRISDGGLLLGGD